VKRKTLIRKLLVLSAWFLVVSGMATLLIAASRKQKEHVCTEVLVGIQGSGEKFYVEKSDVLRMIELSANGSLLKRSVTAFDLSRLEKMLEHSAWIKNAELYFDSKDALHVLVEEREPVARVFTVEGASFYIDSSGHRMPLLDKLSARVPVVTGFTDAKKWKAKDSTLMDEVKQVAEFIYSDKFWNAQIGQIDITPDGSFELIPVIGDHIIKLGDGQHVAEKLGRLFVFYKQVMSKTGFNKYAALDVQFDGQVVAVHKGETSAVDSIQLQKNIEELVNRANLQVVEDDMLPEEAPLLSPSDSAAAQHSVPVKTDPNPAGPKPVSKPVKRMSNEEAISRKQ
jgi:cell division protein FtsQ